MPRTVTLGRVRVLPPITLEEARAAGRAAILPELERIAAEHAPDGGYGETYWHGADGKVFWVAADWSTNEEVAAAEEAFLAVEGILSFESEAEGGAPVDESGEPLPGWELVKSREAERAEAHAAVDFAVAEIQAELDAVEPTHAGVTETLDPAILLEGLDRAPASALVGLDRDSLRAALETLERSHRATADGVVALVASAVQDRGATNGDQVALETLAVLRAFATRPDPAAAQVTVNVPEQAVHVSAPVTVTLPEQPAPVVHVAAPEASPIHVDVHVPEPVMAPAEVHVHVPEQPAAAAPDVHVHVAPAPASAARSVRVEFDAAGNKRYVTEEIAPESGE